jgi:hypothetical protein
LEEYSVQELQECIGTVKIHQIQNTVKSLKLEQAKLDKIVDKDAYVRIQNEIVTQKQREETIHGKTRYSKKTD